VGLKDETLRRKIYLALEGGHAGGLAGRIVEIFLVVLIILNVAGFTLQSVPSIKQPYWFDLEILEVVSVGIFSIEYLLRLWVAIEDPEVRERGELRGRLHAACKPIMLIDFLAVAPVYFTLFIPFLDLRFLRLVRLLRLLKIARYSPALSTLGQVIWAERRALVGTLLVLFCATTFAAAAMHAAEGAVQPDAFGSIPSAMWWAITTLTTVGYGDEVPITALGRIIAGLTMITGMGILALPVGIVATGFMETIHRRDFNITFGMLARVPLFQDFDAKFLSEVMNLLRAQSVSRGEIIAVKGAPASAMYFIVSGEIEVQTRGRSLRFGPGDFLGELALLHQTQRSATMVAVSHCRLLALAADDFAMLIRRYPVLKKRIEEAAARHTRDFGDISKDEIAAAGKDYSWWREDD
jgi:voltage-gated potassium channel